MIVILTTYLAIKTETLSNINKNYLYIFSNLKVYIISRLENIVKAHKTYFLKNYNYFGRTNFMENFNQRIDRNVLDKFYKNSKKFDK